jgi:hypothetical protein
MVSVLTNVTNSAKPAASLLKLDPLAYKHDFFNATLSGYHAAFWIATGFSAVGFILAFFLNKKEHSKDVDVAELADADRKEAAE